MLIDYIYFILIIVIICFIIFLIYLSYEYRNIDSMKNMEHFDTITPLPKLKKMQNLNFDLYTYNKLVNDFYTSYTNIISEVNNRDVTKDNIKNIKLHDKITKNLINSQKLLNIKQNLNNSLAPAQYPIDKLIKTIKSKYNAQLVSTIGYDKKNYSILTNDQCITVNGLCKEEVCLLECQKHLYSSDSQKFKTERITDLTDAAKSMGTTIDKIATTNIYPFNVFKSLVTNNCLTLSTDGITVEPCNLNNIKQQWEISPDENICAMT